MKKKSEKETVRAGKKFTLILSNEYMNNIIKIIKSSEDSCVLISPVTETVKHEIKNKKAADFSGLCQHL